MKNILDIYIKSISFATDKEKTYYKHKCDILDRQIDTEVYKLRVLCVPSTGYGLTEEEIKIIEGK